MNLLDVDFDKLRTVLGTDLEKGLSVQQVLNNREEFGTNELFPAKRNLIDVFRHIISDIMIIMLFIVAFISFFQSGFSKNVFSCIGAIFMIIVYNVFSYFYVKSIDKKSARYTKDNYHVKRSGKIVSIDKRDIVPGDILILDKGDVMPCDGIIIKQKTLRILEANVTGKREPIIKKTHDDVINIQDLPYYECVLFAGTVVLSGKAEVFVCNTGKNIFDSSNFTVLRQNAQTPKIYQTAMYLKKQIYLIWVLLCFLLFCWGIYFEQDVFEMFAFSVAIAVSTFPDAIECFCDITLANMKKNLFNSGCIMRNSGSIDYLCDVNSVFVNSSDYLYRSLPIPGNFVIGNYLYSFSDSKKKASELLQYIILTENNISDFISQEKRIEDSVFETAAVKSGIQKLRIEKENMYISRYSYDKNHRYSCSVVMNGSGYKLIVRGNLDFVLPLCTKQYFDDGDISINDANIRNINQSYKRLASSCEKIYAVAVKSIDYPSSGDQRELCNNMTFYGMFGLYTPISADAASSVALCSKSGVNTYLITDDYPENISSLAKSISSIGVNDYQFALKYSTYLRMNKGLFIADIDRYKAFCEFPPEEKQNIIKYHKDEENITCSIIDDFYDTLPLMESDISFVDAQNRLNSMRLNSDFLLKKKSYSLIPLAINWARTVYKNIVHIMQYILTLQFAMCLTSFICLGSDSKLIFNSPYVFLLGLIMAVPSSFNIALKRPGTEFESNVSTMKNRVSSIQVLIILPVIFGILISLVTSISFQISYFASESYFCGTNAAFITFSLSAFFMSLSFRNEGSLFKNLVYLGKSELITFLLNIFIISLMLFTPLSKLMYSAGKDEPKLSIFSVLLAIVLSFIPFLIREITKVINFNKSDNDKKGE